MAETQTPPAIEFVDLNLWYDDRQALFEVDLQVRRGLVTALIGPSGCGKSTLLRCCNRVFTPGDAVTVRGAVRIFGRDVFDPAASTVQLRRQVGMVFQRPNPLPLSIRDNVLFGHRLHEPARTPRSIEDDLVEAALREVMLWHRVKDRLHRPATDLTLEEQQRLCLARLLPMRPGILLMDEPCSALDPEGTLAIEELIWKLRGAYTILLVTHHMAQARRASEECVFMLQGRVIEHGPTVDTFVAPRQRETADFLEGRFG